MSANDTIRDTKIYHYVYRHFWGAPVLRTLFYLITHKQRTYIKIYNKKQSYPSMLATRLSMFYCLIRYGTSYEEFFIFRFPSLSHKMRNTFITECKRNYYYNILNKQYNRGIFDDKHQTYNTFEKYFGRTLIKVSSIDDFDKVRQFITSKLQFIIKPLSSSGGQGIRLMQSQDIESVDAFFGKLLNEGSHVIEEVIDQHESMAALHPYSVNTVRINTIISQDKDGHACINFHCPFLRIGQNRNCVDNGAQGGILARIDTETGIVYTVGIDEYKNEYILHPNTKKQIVGFTIPKWKEALDLASVLAFVVPSNRFVGWDLALSKNGWVMVEGNPCAQFIGQQISADFSGKKSEFIKLVSPEAR